MPLNKLDNFLKNVEGRILYVSPSDLDSTDSITNEGNSQTRPFKTLQRALIEAARFSYNIGNNNDAIEKTTILLMPGEHIVDNRPGYGIENSGGAKGVSPAGSQVNADVFNLSLDSTFDLSQENNILYKFNSIHGGVIVPRGVSIVGLDLRKTKIRPKYVPNPTNDTPKSAIFRITGGCYFWQFSIFDGDDSSLVYTNNSEFTSTTNISKPTFSHHKLTCFEYADGVNKWARSGTTDLDMYYYKLSTAYNAASTRNVEEKYPASTEGFKSRRPEYEIVGAFANDSIRLTKVESGSNGVPSNSVTVTTLTNHNLEVGTPIKIQNVEPAAYNISAKVTEVDATNPKVFKYSLPTYDNELDTPATNVLNAIVTVETDTVDGSSPYIFNCSLRSVYGMNGMVADGNKSTGFKSMVVAQFTGISLQKDDRAFVKYSQSNRNYSPATVDTSYGTTLSLNSSSTNPNTAYHLDSDAIYRSGWETAHVTISNDAILQIVSVFAIGYNKHFNAESGGDASITNSNSNFGQLALVADGFKRDAFEKDDKAYLTHIITPRSISSTEENIDWLSINTGVTTAVGINSSLYLYGFNDENIKPPFLTQGYRIGAKKNDKLFVHIGGVAREASIYMINKDGSTNTSSVKEYNINAPSNNVFSLVSGNHSLATGEKVIIQSTDGDLPENIKNDTVYYVIWVSNSQFKLASSKTNADSDQEINVYGGSNLKVLSRVTDKSSGDVGHPIQWDKNNNSWYIKTNNNSSIYSNLGSVTEDRTEPTFFTRIADTRNLDDKIYKLRMSIPKELTNSKNPESGFILQESTTTGVRTDGDFTKNNTLTRDDFGYNRNPSFISSCTYDTGTKLVTISADQPHKLNVGDIVTIKNVTTTDNTVGAANSGYNGEFTVSSVINTSEFTYNPNKTLQTSVTNDFNTRNTSLPRFERTDLKSNIYLYRNEIFEEYIGGATGQDGVYHGYPLNASVSVPEEFTTYNYSQNVTDLYPQLDRDNIDANPKAAKTFAVRSPLGKVVTNDLQNSITRESVDKLVKKIGLGIDVSSVSGLSNGISTITLSNNHNLAGILTANVHSGSTGFNDGTYYNVKVYTSEGTQNDSTWNGTRAKVIVSGGSITYSEVTTPGSGWQMSSYGYFDKSVIGSSGSNGRLQNTTSPTSGGLDVNQLSLLTSLVVQFTGSESTADGYFEIKSTPAKNKVAIAATVGDTLPTTDQYAFISGIDSVNIIQTDASGTSTFTNDTHDMNVGSQFQVKDASNNDLGAFTVTENVGVTTFKAITGWSAGTIVGTVLKHAFSSNDTVSEKGDENLTVRGIPLFDGMSSQIKADMTTSSTFVTLVPTLQNMIQRFPYGSYIQINDEIMRCASRVLTGGSSNQLAVIRGVFGTTITSHSEDSLINRIKPIPIEFHRPSILRASGHTFEYLGYGPGNYSTSLPQVQVKTLTEEEEFLSQSQERGAGAVVYTGMNNKGDFYVGNQKQSALTGENTSFDVPVPTIAGQDPGRLSVVFDEVTVKERLVVEGGKSNTSLSEFDGPVTFNNEVQNKAQVKIKDTTESTSYTSGALVVKGGVGIGGTVNIGAGSSIKLPDDSKIIFGDSNDLEIYHGSTQSGNNTNVIRSINSNTLLFETRGGSIAINNRTGDGPTNFENMITATANSHVRLYHNGAKKLQTTQTGVVLTGIATAGYFYGDGSNITNLDDTNITGIITTTKLGGGTADSTTYLNGIGQWATIDTSKLIDSASTTRAEATTSGVTVTGTLDFGADTLDIYHNATDGSIDVKEGSLTLRVKDTAGKGFYIEDPNGSSAQTIAKFEKNSTGGAGRCELMYGGAKVFETVSGGVTITGALEVTGDITALTSDIRLKDEISPITKALDKVKSINGFTYKHNETAKVECNIDTGDQRFAGVSAQEIQAVLPEAVKPAPSNKEYLTVQYEKLVPLLIEAVKELSAKVENLEQKLSDK